MTAATVMLVCWAVLELVVRARDVIGKRGHHGHDRGTRLVIGATFAATVVLALGAPQIAPSLRVPEGVQIVGVGLMCVGLVVRAWAVATLGSSFRTTVEVDPGQEVVSTGPYAWVRHPSYSGLLLIMGGLGLAVGNGLAIAVCIVLPPLALSWRIHVEEAEMVRVLGASYRSYQARTKRLVPGVW